jgi:hypothetical protein
MTDYFEYKNSICWSWGLEGYSRREKRTTRKEVISPAFDYRHHQPHLGVKPLTKVIVMVICQTTSPSTSNIGTAVVEEGNRPLLSFLGLSLASSSSGTIDKRFSMLAGRAVWQ